jgi:hypothetical protein
MQTTYVTLDSPTPHLYYLFESEKFPRTNWLNEARAVRMHNKTRMEAPSFKGVWSDPQRVVLSSVYEIHSDRSSRLGWDVFGSEFTASSLVEGRGSFFHLEEAACTVWFS